MCISVNSDSRPNGLNCATLEIDLLLQLIGPLERLKNSFGSFSTKVKFSMNEVFGI